MKAPLTVYRRFAFSVCVAALLLGGCGGSARQVDDVATIPASQATIQQSVADRSSMHPAAKSGDLIYMSRYASQTVEISTYPKGKPVSTLTGFLQVGGLCTDTKNDVWVVDVGLGRLVEYAHGASEPLRTIKDGNGEYGGPGLSSCAVDPTTGDLAVPEQNGEYTGDIAIYKAARGRPQRFLFKGSREFSYCVYDPAGNLYVSGLPPPPYHASILGELPSGHRQVIKLHVIQHYPYYFTLGQMQWDGKFLAMEIPRLRKSDIVLRFAIQGHTAKLKSIVALKASIGGGFLLQPPYAISDTAAAVAFWNYPNGGRPVKSFRPATLPATFVISFASP